MSDVIRIVGDRFDRRLVEETSRTRVEMAQGFAAVRREMAEGLARGPPGDDTSDGGLRQEMTEGFAALRREIMEGHNALRQELADQRVELLKCAFLFWVGQFFATASLIAVLVRYLRAGA